MRFFLYMLSMLAAIGYLATGCQSAHADEASPQPTFSPLLASTSVDSLADRDSEQTASRLLEHVRVSVGRYWMKGGSSGGSYEECPYYGVSINLKRATTGYPFAFSLYFDYANAETNFLGGGNEARSTRGYGLSGTYSLPSLFQHTVRPYFGAGLGIYRDSDHFNDPFGSTEDNFSAANLGSKVLIGFEVSDRVFVEYTAHYPGLEQLSGRSLSIGFRL